MTCARVVQYNKSNISAIERHIERKNESYANPDVDLEYEHMNVHYKNAEKRYLDILSDKIAAGELSTRGLKEDATLFNEIILDVNTEYFEKNGGYEFAERFYAEAYRFLVSKFGEENIISSVMHADEVNKRVSDNMGKKVFHYHLHTIVIPVVQKEIKWTKRCKDPNLVGTTKEIVNQISHSKKWASTIPLTDETGNIIMRKNGKPKFITSYSLLQDEFYNHMIANGFTDIIRGVKGSTAEHLSSLDYQIEKDKERLSAIEEEIGNMEIVQSELQNVDSLEHRSFLGNINMSKESYESLTSLAKEGIKIKSTIKDLQGEVSKYRQKYEDIKSKYEDLLEKFEKLKDKCKVFLTALEQFPDAVKQFTEKIAKLLAEKEKERKLAEEKRLRERYGTYKSKSRDRER